MRKRKLSKTSKELFGIEKSRDILRQRNIGKSRIKSMLNRLFTTKYDLYLENMNKKCYNSSQHLLHFINDSYKIITYSENMIYNIIMLVLLDDEQKLCSIHKVKQNLRLYYNILDTSIKKKDYNTAVILNIALEHFAISRLEIKLRKKDILNQKFISENLGNTHNYFRKHLGLILKNEDMIPSCMAVVIHRKKLETGIKNVSSITFFNCISDYVHKYAQPSGIQALYRKNLNNIEFINNLEGYDCNTKLINLSKLIKS